MTESSEAISQIGQVSQNRSFLGWHKQYRHRAQSTHCDMRFAIYLPPQCFSGNDLSGKNDWSGTKVPVLYWLSGLTCSDENFMQKAGAQRMAAALGIAIVAPDTSPRGEAVADADTYDLGQGAGFYVNATQAPWDQHYQMYDYVVHELPELIEKHFPVSNKRSIAGHSMGGHGALVVALRNPTRYCSVSAFSPISNPINCPWGQKAFSTYLGSDQSTWLNYDATELIRQATEPVPMKVDQGLADEFLHEQLKPEALEGAATESGYPLQMASHEGYDHSYYFIASFIEEHLRFHGSYLNSPD